VLAQGSLPINYQWLLNGSPVSGATNASYTFPAPCGTNTIQVTFTNGQSGGHALPAASTCSSITRRRCTRSASSSVSE